MNAQAQLDESVKIQVQIEAGEQSTIPSPLPTPMIVSSTPAPTSRPVILVDPFQKQRVGLDSTPLLLLSILVLFSLAARAIGHTRQSNKLMNKSVDSCDRPRQAGYNNDVPMDNTAVEVIEPEIILPDELPELVRFLASQPLEASNIGQAYDPSIFMPPQSESVEHGLFETPIYGAPMYEVPYPMNGGLDMELHLDADDDVPPITRDSLAEPQGDIPDVMMIDSFDLPLEEALQEEEPAQRLLS